MSNLRHYEPENSQQFTKTLPLGVPCGNLLINECIYCGSKSALTNEHTIPRGLWGKNVLEKASCTDCSKGTSKIEGSVLKGSLDTVREFLNASTRHSKKRGNWTGRTIIQNEKGDRLDVPLHILAKFLPLPVFDYLPRKLLQEYKKGKHRKFDVKLIPIHDRQDSVVSGYWDEKEIKMNSNPWARFVAKIAYGEYIRQHDPLFRSDVLSKFIVNDYGDQSNFVGGRNSPPAINAMYKVVFYALPCHKRGHVLVGYLRLFALFESPSYLVYLGKIPPSGNLPVTLCIKSDWAPDNPWHNYGQDEIIEGGPLTGAMVD